MNTDFQTFVDYWHLISKIWAQLALAAALITFAIYKLRLLLRKGMAKKHEYMSKSEIKYYWLTALGLTLSFTFFLSSLIVQIGMTISPFSLAMKTFVTILVGFVIGYVINVYLHVYYPFKLEKKLHKLRFADRLSPVTGKKMRLLTEKEEDVHLTKDMIEHEIISAFEYDVWVDEDSDYRLIETYRGNLQLVICDKCNYRTAHELKEELVEEPTESSEGILKKSYRCSYCSHEQEKVSKIAPLSNV